MDAVIKYVYENSIADEIGIQPGDIVVSIDGQKLRDIVDFKFYSASDEYELEILKADGTTEIIEIVNNLNENYRYSKMDSLIYDFDAIASSSLTKDKILLSARR